MHITYSTIEVRDLCESGVNSLKQLGSRGATLLQRLHADLQAAETLKDLPPLYSTKFSDPSLITIETGEGISILGRIRTIDTSTNAQAIKIEKVLYYE